MQLNVYEDVIKKLDEEQSPTIRLFEYLEVTQPQLTIQQLSWAMRAIQRMDVLVLFREKGNNRSCF